jgi:DNA repair exonuclease SbcCD ATPase subunit
MNFKCTLSDLYEFDEKTGLIDAGFFTVETQHGYKKIEGINITAKNSKKYIIETEYGKCLETSPDHLLFKNTWISVKNLSINNKIKTKDGFEKITKIELLNDIEDLYDIQVDEVQEFFANEIVSHNSTFVELPKILYYGKLDKFKKDEISNRLNKNGYIRGEDEISPDTIITIERKFSPSDLRVEKNNDDIGKAGITDYQTYIDLEVTGLPYHIFSNIISLSINDFKSFISMTPHDKRVIIDKLFAMEIINKMNELVKKDLRDVKTNMDLFDREILTLKNNIDIAVKELQKLKDQVAQDNSEKIIELSKQLQLYKPKLEEGYKRKKEYENKRDEITKSYNIFQQQRMKIQHEITHLENQIKLYDQEKCPTCATPFNDSRFDLIKGRLHENINSKRDELLSVNSDENKYTLALEKIKQGLVTINNFIIQVQTTYNTIDAEMKKLKIDKPQEFLSIQNIISENTINLTNKGDDKVKFDEEYKYLAILEQLYSDAGVKKKILESYLPTLNKEIAFTLNELHFPYNLTFNSDFEPDLYHLGLEISVDTLSTGEKKSVDLAVLVSIIRMLKRKYPQLNIFMLDEVLSSLDNDKIYDILGLLKNVSRELNMNIFVIHQAALPIEYFDYKVEIEKNAGFSDIQFTNLTLNSE